jgi:hypothetical protein
MIEIITAVSIATSAFNAITQAINTGREAQDMVQVFSKFFDAKESIFAASAQHSEGSKIKKLFSGRSVEAQALEITAAKHKTLQLEKELREFLIYTGQGAFYDDMMMERRRIREERIKEVRRIASRNAFIFDLVLGGILVCIGIALIIGMFAIIM